MTTAAMHIARTGLDAQDMRMRVISNNLANVNTTGFKRDRAAFETLAYQTVTSPGAQSTQETKYATGLNLGTGVRIQGAARIDTQGSMQVTGNSLDMALDGDGYFQVQLPGGELGYTRAGNFSRSPEGLLVTSEGYQVMPGITVPEGASAITIGTDGTVSATVPGQTDSQQLGQIQVASFANGAGLLATGDNYLKETAASG
jgi:flagellar basal-body rod protein FlgG